MRKPFTTLAVMMACAGAAPAAASPSNLAGSDTLVGVATDLVTSNCRGATNASISSFITYIGGGSGTGSGAMVAQLTGGSQQVLAPMSRTINNIECNQAEVARAGTRATVQGLVFGLDGIVIVGDSQTSVTCGGGHTDHGDDERPGPSFSDMPVSAASWKSVLKTLFTGYDANNTTQDCKSAARQALAADYKTLFQGGCTDTSICPGGILHAFRRGDLSGTTDTFLSLIGAPGITRDATSLAVTATPFCNGLESEDRDPIRRTCTSSEQVCEYDGTLGLVLPIVVPTNTSELAALYNASNSTDPTDNPTYHNMDSVHGDVAYFGKLKSARGTPCPVGPDASLLTYDSGIPANAALNGVPLLASSVKDVNGVAVASPHFGNDLRCDCRYPVPESYTVVLDANGNPHSVPEFDPTNPSVRQTPPQKAFTWNKRFAGGCTAAYHPNDSTPNSTNVRWGVLNGDDGIGDNTPAVWGTTQVVNGVRRCCRTNGAFYRMDPRLMNLQLRNPTLNSPATVAGSLLGGEGTGPNSLKWATITAFYRIHSNTLGQTAVPNRNLDPTVMGNFVDGDSLCQEQDATRLIACLVQIPSPCSVGYAGREAGDTQVTQPAEPFALGGIDPTVTNIQKLITDPGNSYPLARKLYINTLLGFGSSALHNPGGSASDFASAQFNLYKCFADTVSQRDTNIAAISAALDQAGFVDLPGGPKLCNNMCTTNTSCGTLSPIPAGDLMPAFTP